MLGKVNNVYKDSSLIVVCRPINSQPFGTTFLACDTKGVNNACFYACGGYGGFKIEGYKNKQWENIVSGNHKQSGVIRLNGFNKIKISVSNNTDDVNYNKLGLYVAIMIGSDTLISN
ncbi:MAG: hypothetical protein RR500_05690 [Bacilli bacterium]